MFGMSNGIALFSLATSNTLFAGTNRNSALLSTNFLISQGHAILSTLAFSRVTHFIPSSTTCSSSTYVDLILIKRYQLRMNYQYHYKIIYINHGGNFKLKLFTPPDAC